MAHAIYARLSGSSAHSLSFSSGEAMLKMLGFDVQNRHGDIVRRSRTAISRRGAKVRVRCVVRVGRAHQRQIAVQYVREIRNGL